jgi:hypothetical protein
VIQVVHGMLHLSPRPDGLDCAAAGGLSDELGPPFKRGRGGPGGWLLAASPRCPIRHGDSGLDLRDPVARTARFDRTEKKALYAELGIPYLWIVDPRLRTLETFQLVVGRWVDMGTYADDARPRAVPFDAIEMNLDSLWADGEPTPSGCRSMGPVICRPI